MENDAEFCKTQHETRRTRRRVWLSSFALFFYVLMMVNCVLMMVNLISQAQAVAPPVERQEPIASDLADRAIIFNFRPLTLCSGCGLQIKAVKKTNQSGTKA